MRHSCSNPTFWPLHLLYKWQHFISDKNSLDSPIRSRFVCNWKPYALSGREVTSLSQQSLMFGKSFVIFLKGDDSEHWVWCIIIFSSHYRAWIFIIIISHGMHEKFMEVKINIFYSLYGMDFHLILHVMHEKFMKVKGLFSIISSNEHFQRVKNSCHIQSLVDFWFDAYL